MSNIKKIHCFGTSNSAGGGFEFDAKSKNELLLALYSNVKEKLSAQNFSYSGQLKNLLKSTKVINHSKQGYGNDRMYRLFYDVVNDKNFNNKEHLFLFEFSAFGREEFYSNKLNDYIVCNFSLNQSKEIFEFIGLGKSYNYDSDLDVKILESYNDFFSKYLSEFKDLYVEYDKLRRNADFFISYLEHKKINYLFTSPPSFIEFDKSKEIVFGDDNFFKKDNCIVKFSDKNELLIINETKNKIEDYHPGLKANKIIAHTIYNKMIELGYLNLEKVNIDYENLSKIQFTNFQII